MGLTLNSCGMSRGGGGNGYQLADSAVDDGRARIGFLQPTQPVEGEQPMSPRGRAQLGVGDGGAVGVAQPIGVGPSDSHRCTGSSITPSAALGSS